MHGPAGCIGPGFRHVEGFHDHALPGEGGIAMDEDRHDLVLAIARASILPCPDRTFDHGSDDFQMRGVEGQRGVHRPMARHDVGGEAHVVLDISGAGQRRAGIGTLEFLEQRAGFFAQNVDEDIQASSMRHADDQLPGALFAGALDDFIQQGDQAFGALQGEALLPYVLAVQIALDTLGGGQRPEQ